MSEAKHTPGPWSFDFAAECVWGKDNVVCDMYSDLTEDEWGANGHLIAAAPDLLAACEEAEKYISGIEPLPAGEGLWILKRLHAAIAKAKQTT